MEEEAGEERKSQRTDFVFPVATLISLRTRISLPPAFPFLLSRLSPISFLSTVPIDSLPPHEWTEYEPTCLPPIFSIYIYLVSISTSINDQKSSIRIISFLSPSSSSFPFHFVSTFSTFSTFLIHRFPPIPVD